MKRILLVFSILFLVAGCQKAPQQQLDYKEQEYALLPKVAPVEVSIIGSNDSKDLFQNAVFGSGVVIDPDGFVLTNNHVVLDKYNYAVVFNDGRKVGAQVVYSNATTDLAVLKLIGAGKYQAAELGDSSKLHVDDKVFTLGNGRGNQVANFKDGEVLDLNASISAGTEKLSGLIQTSMRLDSGDSGSPLFNLTGQVVGINVATGEDGSFAIPYEKLREVIKILK